MRNLANKYGIEDGNVKELATLKDNCFIMIVLSMLLQSFKDYAGPEGKSQLRDTIISMDELLKRVDVDEEMLPPPIVAAMQQGREHRFKKAKA